MRYRVLLLFILAACFAPAAHGQGACPSGSPISGNHCYFISAQSGSDSNKGTSESTPWANAPLMSTCSAACASFGTPQPGQVFIFKGCDDWNFATIGEWNLIGVSGSAGNLIYYGGFDQTWYNTGTCPSAWSYPKFDGQGTWPSTNVYHMFKMYGGGANYWRIAYIEFTGLYWTGNISPGYISAGEDSNFEIDHNLFTGATYGTIANDAYEIDLTAGGSYPGVTSAEVDHNVFDNSNNSNYQGVVELAAVGATLEADHNWFGYTDNCIGGGGVFKIDHNTFNYCGTYSSVTGDNVHNNCFENNEDPPSTGSLVYDNLIENCGDPNNSVVTQLNPVTGTTSYVFNNVWTNYVSTGGGQDPFTCHGQSPGPGTCEPFNNTMECGTDSGTNSPPSLTCIKNGDGGATTTLVNYNHFITSGTPTTNTQGTLTSTPNPNLTQTLSAAEAGGCYGIAKLFAPQFNTCATVGAGMSGSTLGSLCSTISGIDAAAGTACQYSTTAGVQLVMSPYERVGGDNVNAVARLTSGSANNDAGAYALGSAISGQPSPPSGLTVTVQ